MFNLYSMKDDPPKVALGHLQVIRNLPHQSIEAGGAQRHIEEVDVCIFRSPSYVYRVLTWVKNHSRVLTWTKNPSLPQNAILSLRIQFCSGFNGLMGSVGTFVLLSYAALVHYFQDSELARLKPFVEMLKVFCLEMPIFGHVGGEWTMPWANCSSPLISSLCASVLA